jgi:tetratricopeptide (TPR) repeat protein
MDRARSKLLLVFAAAWAAYWNSLDGEFVFDDTSLIQNNQQIRSLDWPSLKAIFGSHYWQTVAGQGGLYRPLTVLSYALNYAVGELDPWGYHFVNVLIHALNGVLVVLVVRELFGDTSFAFWSGLLFVLHPIRTEGVAYVVGRAETLAALFFLLAWWCYLQGRWAGAGAAFLAAALSKESALTFLAVPVLSDLVRGRRGEWKAYGALGAAAAAALGLRLAVLGSLAPLSVNASANPLATVGTLERLLTAAAVFGKYLWLLVWPATLSADYSFNQIPVVKTAVDAGFLGGLAGLAVVGAGTAWGWRRLKPLFLCGAFFLATFSLTSNFLRPIGTIMGERLLYLPSLGFTCAAAYGLTRRRRAVWAAAALALAYGGRTVARNADWQDPVTLFSSAVRVSPHSGLAQANLANGLLYRRSDAAGAARHALEAIRIEPGEPAAYMTLADALVKLGDFEQAARAYRRVEELAAGSAGAREAARRREAVERRRR